MKKTILILILAIGALAYFGIIDFNPGRTKEVLINAGKATATQVKKIDKTKITNAAKQTAGAVKEIAQETKSEYQAQ